MVKRPGATSTRTFPLALCQLLALNIQHLALLVRSIALRGKASPVQLDRGTTGIAECLRLLRIQQVMELVGLKKATVYALHRTGQFPRNVKITARAVGWVEEEVQQWLAERPNRKS